MRKKQAKRPIKAKDAVWTDEDLARSLSRTFRWGGKTVWPMPLTVAQHSLNVLAMLGKSATDPLSRSHALRELLHDADAPSNGEPEAIGALKSFHGKAFPDLGIRQQLAVFSRYKLIRWTPAEFERHKLADIIIAASEAVHVVGWTESEVQELLHIGVTPLIEDPLAEIYDCRPWEPWSPEVAAERFFEVLVGQGAAFKFGPNKTALRPLPTTSAQVPALHS